jgi:hypothetical protein
MMGLNLRTSVTDSVDHMHCEIIHFPVWVWIHTRYLNKYRLWLESDSGGLSWWNFWFAVVLLGFVTLMGYQRGSDLPAGKCWGRWKRTILRRALWVPYTPTMDTTFKNFIFLESLHWCGIIDTIQRVGATIRRQLTTGYEMIPSQAPLVSHRQTLQYFQISSLDIL